MAKFWYEERPEILQGEKMAMQRFFPQFKMDKLSDGRLYWYGSVNPRGNAGGTWTLMAIYNHDHPSNSQVNGSSVRIYSIKPDLNELYKACGNLPHVLRDQDNNLFMCTARQEDVKDGKNVATSAATSLGWAVKWIYLVESWLAGEIGREVFDHGAF